MIAGGVQEEGDKELVLWSEVEAACAGGKRTLPIGSCVGQGAHMAFAIRARGVEAVLLSLSLKISGWPWLLLALC